MDKAIFNCGIDTSDSGDGSMCPDQSCFTVCQIMANQIDFVVHTYMYVCPWVPARIENVELSYI